MSKKMMRTLIGTALILCAAEAIAGDVSKVTVWDHDFRVIRIIEDKELLDAFANVWAEKQVHKGSEIPKFEYKLDIERKGHSDRWLYDSRGFAQVLSKAVVPVHVVPTPEAFNAIIGAHNTGFQPDAPQAPRR